MKTPSGPARGSGRAKSKAKRTPRSGRPRKSAAPSKSAPKARKQAGPSAGGAERIEARTAERVAVGRSRVQPRVAQAQVDAAVRTRGSGATNSTRELANPASRRIDQRIRELGGWRGETLARMRALILKADPEITEEWKWMGTPVWSHDGIVCTGETYKQVVKLTFARGAALADPARLFNSSLEGNTRRAIDLHEGEQIDARAFQALVKTAVAHNHSRTKQR